MTPYTLFVADVHLQPEQNHPINQAFNKFLIEEAPKAEALYILGDLFEMWVGDDIGLEVYSEVVEQLKKLTSAGLPVYLQFGNRDFLMGKAFWQATGIQKLADLHKERLYGEEYLMLHGDTLCTDDAGYQRMRKIFRNPVVIWIFLHLCKKRRLIIGNKMRANSKEYSQNKPSAIMDVNNQAVCDLFNEHQTVKHMIHGHTHRPDHHILEVQHTTLNRWILGDWRVSTDTDQVTAKLIKISPAGPEFIDYH